MLLSILRYSRQERGLIHPKIIAVIAGNGAVQQKDVALFDRPVHRNKLETNPRLIGDEETLPDPPRSQQDQHQQDDPAPFHRFHLQCHNIRAVTSRVATSPCRVSSSVTARLSPNTKTFFSG